MSKPGTPTPQYLNPLHLPLKREQRLTAPQLIRSTAYTNFSILGLTIIFAVGSLIILLSWILEPLTACIQQRRRRRSNHTYSRIEWNLNDTLQLQRLAHEEAGFGSWRHCDEGVPVTKPGDRLGVVDLEDLAHPRLKAPPPREEEVLLGEVDGGGGKVGAVEGRGDCVSAKGAASCSGVFAEEGGRESGEGGVEMRGPRCWRASPEVWEGRG